MSRRAPARVVRAGAAVLHLALVGAVAAAAAGRAAAQEVRTAVAGDSIRVGDVVPVAVRVTLKPGQRVVFPDTLAVGGGEPGEGGVEMENAARVRERVDTLADGRIQVTGVYSVTPWRPGEASLPELPVQVVSPDERARTLSTELPTFTVASVLPADTAGIELKPARGVLGGDRTWWPLLLLLLGLIAVALLFWGWWRRRRRTAAVPAAPAIPPREAALAALQAVRDEGLAERGEMKEFYTRISAAVRDYLAAVEPAWSEDLTTTEVLGRVRGLAGAGAASPLGAVLRSADQVKFARREPDVATAHAEWESARTWVDGFRWPPPALEVEEAA